MREAREYYEGLEDKPNFTELTGTGINENRTNVFKFAEGYASSQWINPKDKLPEIDEVVLIETTMVDHLEIARFEYDEFYIIAIDDSEMIDNVVRWLPFTQPKVDA